MSALGPFFLPSEAETIQAGEALAAFLKPGDIVKITGPLGAGKTTWVRGLVAGLGGDPAQVHSPTFSLVHPYQGTRIPVMHCDFYRLPPGSELEDFGGAEFFDEPKIFLLEWPERVEQILSTIPQRILGADLRQNAQGRNLLLQGDWNLPSNYHLGC